MRSPKVLFVIHQIGSGADGGIRSLAEIARAVPELTSAIVTNIEGPFTESLRQFAPVKIWPMVEVAYRGKAGSLGYRAAQTKARLTNNLRTWRAIRKDKVTVLHANEQRAFWNTAIGARLAGVPVIFNVRDTMPVGSRSVRQWRRALSLCDRFLVLSKEMVAAWRTDLKPTSETSDNADKFVHLYSIVDRERYFPVDARRRSALRSSLGVDDDRPAIVYVGRFDHKKAQLAFIEGTLPAINAARPDAITYFVGDFEPDRDPYAAACCAAVERLRLTEAVQLVGYSDRTADWYRAADIVALASQREGLPRCMIESIACGAAFVTFDVCSTREVLEGHDCGAVVPQGDYAGLAAAITALLGDKARREQYGERGPRVVAELFDRTTNGELYRELVRSLSIAKASR